LPAILRNRKVQIAGQAVVITALLGGTAAFVGLNKPVTVTVDGEAQQVRSFGHDVADVLDSQGIEVSGADEVQPALSTPIERGSEIVVNTEKDVQVVLDGRHLEETTYGNTVAQALADLGIDARGADLSLPVDAPVESGETVIEVATDKAIQVLADGEAHPVEGTTVTVSEALTAAGVEVGEDDIVSAPLNAHVVDGQKVRVLRVVEETVTEDEEIDYETETKDSDDLYKGETRVETEGKKGSKKVTYDVRKVDGKETRKEKLEEEVTEEPVTRVVLEGTKERSSSGSGSSSGSSGGGNTGREAPSVEDNSVWDRLAQCESGGNWSINTGNGFYGGLQFMKQTWDAMGGGQYAEYPHQATREQQIDIGKKLQRQAGWGQWPSCSRQLGLR
jgi:uncharacterized protein YabE (DUF348 family)